MAVVKRPPFWGRPIGRLPIESMWGKVWGTPIVKPVPAPPTPVLKPAPVGGLGDVFHYQAPVVAPVAPAPEIRHQAVTRADPTNPAPTTNTASGIIPRRTLNTTAQIVERQRR